MIIIITVETRSTKCRYLPLTTQFVQLRVENKLIYEIRRLTNYVTLKDRENNRRQKDALKIFTR